MSALTSGQTPTCLARVLALTMWLGSASTVLAADAQVSCDELSQHLQASYTISSNRGKDVTLNFWRADSKVLYHYPDRHLADQWTVMSNGYLKPVRYFTADKRAIEYDAFDINGGRGSRDWESRSHWITRDQLEAMQLTGSEGEGCMKTETYEYSPRDETGKAVPFSTVSLSWLPELQLVQSYRVRSTDSLGQRRIIQWQLDVLKTDKALVETALHAYDGYAAADYADVGDNESDPFLMKMIKLGFVQHGASGFYDSDGSPLSGGHVH